jgi:RNA polymerase sigma-70 factor (ECF subfamily)
VNVSSVPPDSEGQSSQSARPSAPTHGREIEALHLVELITLSSRGHDEAFAELYDLTSQRIYGIILRVLRSPDHAAEVMQEVYVEVWRQSARYSPGKGSVIAWMTTIAHRRAVDRVRSVASEVAREERYAFQRGEREIDQVWDGVEQRFDVERVRRGMASLTPIQREALTLAYFGGYTVKTRIRDGLIGLRDALGVEA